jgi:hypothetical protein
LELHHDKADKEYANLTEAVRHSISDELWRQGIIVVDVGKTGHTG